jgi:putative peptidoglycan lipid II flippase
MGTLHRQTTRVAALSMTVLAGATLGLTFVQQIVIAKLFGASNLTDAYLIAQTLPLLLGNQCMLTVSAVAIPLLAESHIRGGPEEMWRLWRTLLVCTFTVTITVAALCTLGSALVIALLGAGADSMSLRTARNLFLLMVPAFVCVICSGLPRAMHHSVQSFAVPSGAQLCVPLGIVSGAILLSARYGIYSVALGAVVGAFVMLAILFLPLSPLRSSHLSQLSGWLPVAAAGKSVMPIFICLSVVQIYLVIGRSFAAGLASGSVAAMGFSASIMSIPLQLFSTTLGTVVFPRVCALVALKKDVEVRDLVLRGLRLALFSVVPFIVFFLIFPVEIVQYVLQRGSFSAADTKRTAHALMGCASGLPGFAINQVAVFAMIAISEWSAAAKIGILTILLDFPLRACLKSLRELCNMGV